MKKSSLIQRYKRDIAEIEEELIRLNERNNPKENYVIDRIASRKTTLLQVIEDIKSLESLK